MYVVSFVQGRIVIFCPRHLHGYYFTLFSLNFRQILLLGISFVITCLSKSTLLLQGVVSLGCAIFLSVAWTWFYPKNYEWVHQLHTWYIYIYIYFIGECFHQQRIQPWECLRAKTNIWLEWFQYRKWWHFLTVQVIAGVSSCVATYDFWPGCRLLAK